MKNFGTILMSLLVMLFLTGVVMSPSVSANESAVEIEVQDKDAEGGEINIVLHVSHEGNNFIHHTEWVELRINGELSKRWEYSMFNKPSGENFSVSFSYPAKQDFEAAAEAYCNLHGSRNIDKKRVSVTADRGGAQ